MKNSDFVFFTLFHFGVSIQQLNKRSEKQLGLSMVQWCLLKTLIDLPASSAHSLSKAVGVHPSTLTQTLKRLQKKEFIFITEDPKDSRKKLISITRSGKNILESTSDKMITWLPDPTGIEKELSKLQSFLNSNCKNQNNHSIKIIP